MKTKLLFFLSVFFFVEFSTACFSQENGAFGSYLVGTYDLRSGTTVISVVNPTGHNLYLYVAFFNDNEKGLKCLQDRLSPNDLVEYDVGRIIPKESATHGVVKIVSVKDTIMDMSSVIPGIVGFQKKFTKRPWCRSGMTECNMAAIPLKSLDEEMKILKKVCY